MEQLKHNLARNVYVRLHASKCRKV